VKSDDSRRDAQFEGRIMDTLTHPQATFRLTTPIVLSDTSTAQTTSHSATGDLTLRGTSKQVQITIISSVDDDTISLVGEIVIVFDEWGIPNPSLPGISTEDRGILEFNLILER
jgi:polyisoprenoid-binding protein YceI